MFKSSSTKTPVAKSAAAKAFVVDAARAASAAAAQEVAKKAAAKVQSDKKFYDNVDKVVEYFEAHGDMKVPTKGHELSQFVSETRRTGHNIIQGKPQGSIKLDKARIETLNSIGFDWGMKIRGKFPEDKMP